MNPADEISRLMSSDKPPQGQFMKELRDQTISQNNVGRWLVDTSTAANSNAFSVVNDTLATRLLNSLERISSYTSEVRGELQRVEVLDELWDNGEEVVVIPKRTLELLERLLQEINEANHQ